MHGRTHDRTVSRERQQSVAAPQLADARRTAIGAHNRRVRKKAPLVVHNPPACDKRATISHEKVVCRPLGTDTWERPQPGHDSKHARCDLERMLCSDVNYFGEFQVLVWLDARDCRDASANHFVANAELLDGHVTVRRQNRRAFLEATTPAPRESLTRSGQKHTDDN
jgi:hypothetical protein